MELGAASHLVLRHVLLPGGRAAGRVLAALLVATRQLFAVAALNVFTMAQQHIRFLLEAGTLGVVTLLGQRLRRR